MKLEAKSTATKETTSTSNNDQKNEEYKNKARVVIATTNTTYSTH